MLQGQPYAPLLQIGLDGKANNGSPYWAMDYKNIAPRIAFAWSPNSSGTGWLSHLLGSSGKTSVRGGFGIYYDHFGEGIVNSFDKNGSFGLSTQLSNPASVLSPDTAPRFSGLNTIPPLLGPSRTCGVISRRPTQHSRHWWVRNHLGHGQQNANALLRSVRFFADS